MAAVYSARAFFATFVLLNANASHRSRHGVALDLRFECVLMRGRSRFQHARVSDRHETLLSYSYKSTTCLSSFTFALSSHLHLLKFMSLHRTVLKCRSSFDEHLEIDRVQYFMSPLSVQGRRFSRFGTENPVQHYDLHSTCSYYCAHARLLIYQFTNAHRTCSPPCLGRFALAVLYRTHSVYYAVEISTLTSIPLRVQPYFLPGTLTTEECSLRSRALL